MLRKYISSSRKSWLKELEKRIFTASSFSNRYLHSTPKSGRRRGAAYLQIPWKIMMPFSGLPACSCTPTNPTSLSLNSEWMKWLRSLRAFRPQLVERLRWFIWIMPTLRRIPSGATLWRMWTTCERSQLNMVQREIPGPDSLAAPRSPEWKSKAEGFFLMNNGHSLETTERWLCFFHFWSFAPLLYVPNRTLVSSTLIIIAIVVVIWPRIIFESWLHHNPLSLRIFIPESFSGTTNIGFDKQ